MQELKYKQRGPSADVANFEEDLFLDELNKVFKSLRIANLQLQTNSISKYLFTLEVKENKYSSNLPTRLGEQV